MNNSYLVGGRAATSAFCASVEPCELCVARPVSKSYTAVMPTQQALEIQRVPAMAQRHYGSLWRPVAWHGSFERESFVCRTDPPATVSVKQGGSAIPISVLPPLWHGRRGEATHLVER